MFDFQNAEVSKGSYKETIKPGIHQVKIVSITNGLSTQKQSPYVEFTVEDAQGAELKHQYYLSTIVGEGKQKSAWDITKNVLLSIVASAYSLESDSAKSKMPQASSVEDLVNKLSTILVGKEIRIKVAGEEKIAQKSGNKYVSSSFAQGVMCESIKVPTSESKLFFNVEKNIKRLPEAPEAPVMSTTTVEDPF